MKSKPGTFTFRITNNTFAVPGCDFGRLPQIVSVNAHTIVLYVPGGKGWLRQGETAYYAARFYVFRFNNTDGWRRLREGYDVTASRVVDFPARQRLSPQNVIQNTWQQGATL